MDVVLASPDGLMLGVVEEAHREDGEGGDKDGGEVHDEKHAVDRQSHHPPLHGVLLLRVSGL